MPDGTTPPASGKKMWYVIGGIVILLLLGWVATRGIFGVMMAGSGVNVSGVPGGSTYTDNQGNSVTVGGGSMPDNWPSDAPQNYAGASIQYSGNSNPQTGKSGATVSYTVHAAAQAVADYYKQQLTSAGWHIEGTANTGGATIISATKDSRNIGVYVVDSGDGLVTVTAGVGQ